MRLMAAKIMSQGLERMCLKRKIIIFYGLKYLIYNKYVSTYIE